MSLRKRKREKNGWCGSANEHVYNPADITRYANWRLDLADANGLALGDDEAESAMRQL